MQLLRETIEVAQHIYVVRPASDQDIAGIVALVDIHAKEGHLLPRTADEIRASLTNWVVATCDEQVIAIGSLVEMNPQLVEVRSLAVLPAHRSSGVGARIVTMLVALAEQHGYKTIFALTRAVNFFLRLDFAITNKDRFPEKVWRDCVKCPLVTCCDETAVVYVGPAQTTEKA